MVTDWSDSTVYLPYVVEIERDDGEVRAYPAHFVTLTPDFVFVRDPAGGFDNVPTRSIRSARVTVQELPADHDVVRAEYPNAYLPWDNHVEPVVRNVHESATTLAAAARQCGRPPAHLAAKAREFGYDLSEKLNTAGHEPEPEPDALQALFARRAARNDYLVICKPGVSSPYQVLSRHRIDPVDLYRLGSWGFGVPLTGYQLERAAGTGGPALPEDPDVDRIELDHDRLAPHFRTSPERRVDGEYLVSVRGSGDPLTVAARAGVSPHSVLDSINVFGGAMTDAQIQALRRDPDVDHIEDNSVVELD